MHLPTLRRILLQVLWNRTTDALPGCVKAASQLSLYNSNIAWETPELAKKEVRRLRSHLIARSCHCLAPLSQAFEFHRKPMAGAHFNT